MGPASWRAARGSARFSKELDFLEPGNVNFCSPVHYCSPRLEPRPQLSSNFGLSPDHRNFRKNFRESLVQGKSLVQVEVVDAHFSFSSGHPSGSGYPHDAIPRRSDSIACTASRGRVALAQ